MWLERLTVGEALLKCADLRHRECKAALSRIWILPTEQIRGSCNSTIFRHDEETVTLRSPQRARLYKRCHSKDPVLRVVSL
jgi:hypothetical protein